MTVAELITALRKFAPHLEVTANGFEILEVTEEEDNGPFVDLEIG